MGAPLRRRESSVDRERWDSGRTEAFSDGVFAIAVTLLVLDLGVPPSGLADLPRAILHEWPSYLGYATSLLTIGGLWLAHHTLFRRLQFANSTVIRINLVLLMAVHGRPNESVTMTPRSCPTRLGWSLKRSATTPRNGLRSSSTASRYSPSRFSIRHFGQPSPETENFCYPKWETRRYGRSRSRPPHHRVLRRHHRPRDRGSENRCLRLPRYRRRGHSPSPRQPRRPGRLEGRFGLGSSARGRFEPWRIHGRIGST
jgi:Endosomal/lysosomal potassium channel TMEM175